jgi:hypothetical protein
MLPPSLVGSDQIEKKFKICLLCNVHTIPTKGNARIMKIMKEMQEQIQFFVL